MARNGGFWAELQREQARQIRLAQQRQREQERALRAAERRLAADERERKKLHIEARKAEAAESTADLESTIEELETLLTSRLGHSTSVSFASMKHTFQPPPFDAGGLDKPLSEPQWTAPPQPGAFARLFGGRSRFEREEAAARQRYEREKAEYEAAETERGRQLAERRHAYQRWITETVRQTNEHNKAVDEFERSARSGDSDAVARFFTLVLDVSPYPENFPHRTRVIYRPEAKELVIDFELPPQEIVPTSRGFRYVQARDEIDPLPRPVKEVKERYAKVIAQVTLRTLHEVFSSPLAGLVDVATFNGHVSTKDKATGQPIRPCLMSVSATRDVFSTLVLADLDPVLCLKRLNALVSPHPYDLEAVRPVVDFDALLSQYKFVEGIDAVAGLDSRHDLLAMTPTEFEHLTRQLFEAMGMQSWVTQSSKDDGVDAVAVSEDFVFGGLCIIQAKRYSKAVGIEAVRALAGVMEDKHATKGILVTTSWVGKDSRDFASRHGRIRLIECEELKYLCKEHLGLDVLISLPKPPPHRR